ncbi:MAG: hypothetical protein KIT31_23725 [Deltaproteobacteria bacterium]|nr:hypothetical protein [Deltaproteobacteria bacterium]
MNVVAWLLEGDPAVRWQVKRDLLGGDGADEERARVGREGVGARILARQGADGAWQREGEPDWLPTLFAMQMLRATGADPGAPEVAAAVERLARGFRWHEELGGRPFFEGETEPCINGGALALGGYFGRPDAALAQRLIGEQLGDGGWNCEAPQQSSRGSYHSTICVLEGLLEYERASGASTAGARRRGEAYLLERGMFRRRSTGEPADPRFLELAFPTRYCYDVLRGLDYLRAAGAAPDERAADAIRALEARRRSDGRWSLDAAREDVWDGDERLGEPSRWITLRALRVLRWYGR